MNPKRTPDNAKFNDRVDIKKRVATSVLIEGMDVPIIHQYGHGGDYPTVRAGLAKLADRIATKFGVPSAQDRFKGSETIIVEKFKEVNVAGIGNDAVNILANKGYGFRQICSKIGQPVLKEINISHAIKHYRPAWLNLMLNEGIIINWELLREANAVDYFTNALARTGVGNSTTVAAATDTGLIGGSTAFVAMEATFPTLVSQTINFKGSYASGVAEFAWEEFTVDNGSTPDDNLQRLVTPKGTKSTGETWTAEIQITGS